MITAIQTKTTTYMSKVFGWMLYAMVISGITSVALYNASADIQYAILSKATIFWFLQLGAVIGLGLLLRRINTVVAFILFTVYSMLTGVTLTIIMYAYAPKMIGGAFLMAAGIYGVMAVIGYTTKINLSGLRTFFIMAVLGIIGMSILNIFLGSDMLGLILSYVVIVVFAGLTAYDMQRIRQTSEMGYTDTKYALYDALGMYINFINIFLSILNIVSRD
jgi:uncharacterized protein